MLAGCASNGSHEIVITFNLCGNVCAHGSEDGVSFVKDLARRADADAVFLQEVCRSQADLLRERLPTFEVWYVTTFAGDANGLNDCPGDDIGVAVATSRPVDRRFTLPLPNPGIGSGQLDERLVACVQVTSPVEVFCTTHLTRPQNDARAHQQQVAALPSIARELTRRSARVVLAGDFNASSAELRDLTRAGYIDSRVAPTAVDHVISRRSVSGARSVRSTRCGCSDHAAVIVELTP